MLEIAIMANCWKSHHCRVHGWCEKLRRCEAADYSRGKAGTHVGLVKVYAVPSTEEDEPCWLDDWVVAGVHRLE